MVLVRVYSWQTSKIKSVVVVCIVFFATVNAGLIAYYYVIDGYIIFPVNAVVSTKVYMQVPRPGKAWDHRGFVSFFFIWLKFNILLKEKPYR